MFRQLASTYRHCSNSGLQLLRVLVFFAASFCFLADFFFPSQAAPGTSISISRLRRETQQTRQNSSISSSKPLRSSTTSPDARSDPQFLSRTLSRHDLCQVSHRPGSGTLRRARHVAQRMAFLQNQKVTFFSGCGQRIRPANENRLQIQPAFKTFAYTIIVGRTSGLQNRRRSWPAK